MLVTPAYQALISQLHAEDENWGRGAKHFVDRIRKIIALTGDADILDYGCGKGSLQELLGFPISEYDPGIPGKDSPPKPANLVVCAEVLEHVEPECLDAVLADLRRCTRRIGFFAIPHNPAIHNLPDGRNTHINVHPHGWWVAKLGEYFTVHSATEVQAITAVRTDELMLGSRTFFIVY
jgi:hypothetical protein